jgi:sugar fermentation stimulation protein A
MSARAKVGDVADRESVPLVSARFVDRPNRFIVRARIGAGRAVEAHLGDPGRLIELLRPGASLKLRPTTRPGRRTRFSAALVRAPTPPAAWVGLEPARANRLARWLLTHGAVHGAGSVEGLRAEVRHENHRFDFLTRSRDGRESWVEVKAVTLVERGVGRFPDAPTARGRRHLAALSDLARAGGRTLVLFVTLRDDVSRVAAHDVIDPDFALALVAARRAGVLVRGARFALDRRGDAVYGGPVRVS